MRFGVQLYTLREHTKTWADFESSLGRVSEMGWQSVQCSATGCFTDPDPRKDAEKARPLLDKFNLACAATHRSLERLEDFTAEEIEFHQILGCQYTAIGSGPKEAYENQGQGFAELGERLTLLRNRLAEGGIKFGFHNHHSEFARTATGETYLQRLLDHAASDFEIELDTYWAAHAGMDLLELIPKWAGRLTAVHLKDKEVHGWDVRHAPIGEGNMNWPSILAALLEAGTKEFLVEQDDCFRDPFDCLQSSFNYLDLLKKQGQI